MQSLIGSGRKVAAVVSGAGANLIQALWETPGASEYLVEASMPYALDSTLRHLYGRPDKMVSAEVAYRLAASASHRSQDIGIGLTASVAGLREHRGEHEAFICVVGPRGCRMDHITFKKRIGAEARRWDDEDCTNRILTLIDLETARDFVIYPGSFNPMHWGHKDVMHMVSEMTGLLVEHQIERFPKHKPELSYDDMVRLAEYSVLFTSGQPLYIDKARRNPGKAMIVGVDALRQMLDPKWGHEPVAMLDEFDKLGTKFYVPGRVISGVETRLKDIDVLGFDRLFIDVPVCTDVSSTQIREQTSAKAYT